MENSIENSKAKELFGEIKKRKVEDTIIIEGRTFKLHKFDPLLGNYILLQLFTVALPFGIGDMLSSAVGSEIPKNEGMIPTFPTVFNCFDLERTNKIASAKHEPHPPMATK